MQIYPLQLQRQLQHFHQLRQHRWLQYHCKRFRSRIGNRLKPRLTCRYDPERFVRFILWILRFFKVIKNKPNPECVCPNKICKGQRFIVVCSHHSLTVIELWRHFPCIASNGVFSFDLSISRLVSLCYPLPFSVEHNGTVSKNNFFCIGNQSFRQLNFNAIWFALKNEILWFRHACASFIDCPRSI